jgi:UDP-N-acetyl-D-glucosamine dehydrogenase
VTNLESAMTKRTVAIVGQGYVGLPLAVAAASAGWKVIGIEKSSARVADLKNAKSPVEDVSDGDLQRLIKEETYSATSDPSAVATCEIVIICVPTPLSESREPDISLLIQAIKDISPHLAKGTLIISESTSYPGTLRDVIIPLVKENSPQSAGEIFFASAPERVNPGDKNWNMKNTPRLVGGIDEKSQELAISFYETFCDEVVSTSSPEIAEAAKLLENTFRMVNISLIQELTQILNKAGISANEVIDASSTKPYGFMPFRPSVGIGGHCIPVDPIYLTWWARQQGSSANLVEKADQISLSMPQYIASKALSLVENPKSPLTVMILGVAYKPGVSDTRESPVSLLKSSLEAAGATVIWHDPLVKEWAGSKSSDLDSTFDVAVIATNQPGMDVASISARGIRILDCTNNFGHLDGVEVL